MNHVAPTGKFTERLGPGGTWQDLERKPSWSLTQGTHSLAPGVSPKSVAVGLVEVGRELKVFRRYSMCLIKESNTFSLLHI